jgi:hypothetical protein
MDRFYCLSKGFEIISSDFNRKKIPVRKKIASKWQPLAFGIIWATFLMFVNQKTAVN